MDLHPVFTRSEPSWTDTDMFAHLTSFDWTLDVDWTEVVGTVTTVFTASASGSTTDKRFIKDDQTSYDDWFAGYGYNKTMLPALPSILGGDKSIYGRFAPLGIIGTRTETDGGDPPLVSDVDDGDGWEITIKRLTDVEVEADYPAEIGLRAERSGVFSAIPIGASEYSTNLIELPALGDFKTVVEGGTATATKTTNITGTGYSFTGTFTLVITTA